MSTPTSIRAFDRLKAIASVFATTLAFATATRADPNNMEFHGRVGDPESQPAAPPSPDSDGVADPARGAAAEATRESRMLPFTISPRVSDKLVTGRFLGGYDGGHREAVGEAIAEGRITRFLAVRAGASSSDLWGHASATFGIQFGILREETAPLDLGLAVLYHPQSIRGDGLVSAALLLGKKIGPVSTFGTLGYGQDPEGDDFMGWATLGAMYALSGRFRVGLDNRVRFQLGSDDEKFKGVVQPTMDFCTGPLLAYSLGPFDVTAQGGIAGLVLESPETQQAGERSVGRLGPLALLGLAAEL
jgi:hypothetical protein